MDNSRRSGRGAAEPDVPERISVGLAIADRATRQHVRHLMQRMPSIDLADEDDADVVLTDAPEPVIGPCLRVGDVRENPNTGNLIDARAEADVVEAAIRLVAHGYRIRAPASVHGGDRSDAPSNTDFATPVAAVLTLREREVLELLATGAPNKSIARHLDIAPATAKFHVASVIAKLGAHNRTDAVAIGIKAGLLLL